MGRQLDKMESMYSFGTLIMTQGEDRQLSIRNAEEHAHGGKRLININVPLPQIPTKCNLQHVHQSSDGMPCLHRPLYCLKSVHRLCVGMCACLTRRISPQMLDHCVVLGARYPKI